METVQSVDGTAIAYERTGVGQPLVIIGGAFNTRMSSAGLAALLSDRFTVYRYDRRGRGDSGGTREAADYSIDWEVEDLAAVLRETGGIPFIYGHSSGGALALESSARGIVMQKLAVYEPPYSGPDGPTPEFAQQLRALVADGRREDAAEQFMGLMGMSADAIGHTKQSPYWSDMVAIAQTLPYDVALSNGGEVPVKLLGDVAVPTLAIAGGDGPAWAANAARAIAMYVPDATYVILPGQTHGVADDVIAPVLAEWFGEVV
jgi:pimeloyl-ACP methyl ester carboxylesterase